MEEIDFKKIQKSLDLSVLLIDEINGLNFDEINITARDLLFSQLKKAVGRITIIVTNYD